MLAACGYIGWRYASTRAADAAVDPRSSAQSGPPPIPVTFSRVQLADFPVYLNGLGTVQAYNTVTVRSRVDGEITKIAFKEGQIVKEGDFLVQIDPRPFQAALDQATAKKAQDEASLKNAQLDLKRFTDLARQDFASRQQVDTQQATVDQFTAQIRGDQAAIDNAKTQLSYTTINAPISGRIGFRLVDPGQYRARLGHERDAVDRPAAADLGGLHRARGGCAADQQGARGGSRAPDGAQQRRLADALARQARTRRQLGRSGERHHPHEGDLREQG